MKPEGQNVLLVDCHDLDQFILKCTGREWNTLEVAASGGQDYLRGSGQLDMMEADWRPDLWVPAKPDEPYYEDTIWGQIDLVEHWLKTGEAHQYLRTDSILCYLVREGKLDPDTYAIHLWW